MGSVKTYLSGLPIAVKVLLTVVLALLAAMIYMWMPRDHLVVLDGNSFLLPSSYASFSFGGGGLTTSVRWPNFEPMDKRLEKNAPPGSCEGLALFAGRADTMRHPGLEDAKTEWLKAKNLALTGDGEVFGLEKWIQNDESGQPAADVYLGRDEAGKVVFFAECAKPQAGKAPICNSLHVYRDPIRIGAHFNPACLAHWQDIRSKSNALLARFEEMGKRAK